MPKYKTIEYSEMFGYKLCYDHRGEPIVSYYITDGDELVRAGKYNAPVEFTTREEAEVYAALLNAIHEEEAAAKRALWLGRACDVGALALIVALVVAGFSITEPVNAWVSSWR